MRAAARTWQTSIWYGDSWYSSSYCRRIIIVLWILWDLSIEAPFIDGISILEMQVNRLSGGKVDITFGRSVCSQLSPWFWWIIFSEISASTLIACIFVTNNTIVYCSIRFYYIVTYTHVSALWIFSEGRVLSMLTWLLGITRIEGKLNNEQSKKKT